MGPRVSRPALENCLQDLPGVKIDGKQVEETDEILGSGAYGEVIVAMYNGVRYASKKLHEALVENDERISPNDPNSPVRKFREECQRMSQLRHPNIVQFIGVYFKPNSPPCLLMELLPICLAEFLEDKTNIGFDRKCFILLDVAKGLLCLHSHSPPIIHRDLTANNVLLTSGLTAKIADFGVARYLPLPTETGGQYMTICPGNLNYMPPEAKKENALYNTKLDIFSFGHLTVYVATRKWPILKDRSFENPITGDTVYRTEIERRDESLEMITKENLKLRQLAILCLHDDAKKRPLAKNIIDLLTEMIPDTDSKSQTLLDEIDQLKQELQAKVLEVKQLKRQLAMYKGGPVLRIASDLPLKCTQEADGSISLRLSFQPTLSTDPFKSNTDISSQDEQINIIEASFGIAISDTLTTNGSTKPQSIVINSKQPEPMESPAPTQHVMSNKVPSEAVRQSGFTCTESLSQNEVTESTNSSVESQSETNDGKQPEPTKTPDPIQRNNITNNIVPPVPVPRARTRGHTSKAEAVPSMEANTNPVEVFPLVAANNQSSAMTFPRSNTVCHLDVLHVHNVENGTTLTDNLHEQKDLVMEERQRSQTLPKRLPTARRNLPKIESGGPNNELQALLTKRRQWEQN